MSVPLIYLIFQELFPKLQQQDLPLESPEHFGQFFDWLNLNDTYLQALDLDQYQEHGFEDNIVLQQHSLAYAHFSACLQQKIARLIQTHPHYSDTIRSQEILRLIISELNQFLQQYQLDLIIIILHQQKYWLTYPHLEQNQRIQLLQTLKSYFNHEMPIQVLDPQKMALFW